MRRPSPKHSQAPLLVAVGEALRARRQASGVSQLALLAEIDRAYLGGVERGEHNLTLMSLGRLCEALNVRPSALLNSQEKRLRATGL